MPWLTETGRRNFVKMFRYYTFTGKQISYEVGHNPVAAMAYAGVFVLFLVQIFSGFALYAQYRPDGVMARGDRFMHTGCVLDTEATARSYESATPAYFIPRGW